MGTFQARASMPSGCFSSGSGGIFPESRRANVIRRQFFSTCGFMETSISGGTAVFGSSFTSALPEEERFL